MEARSLSHWTATEVPPFFFSNPPTRLLRFAFASAWDTHREPRGSPSLAGLCGPSALQNRRVGIGTSCHAGPVARSILSSSCTGFSAQSSRVPRISPVFIHHLFPLDALVSQLKPHFLVERGAEETCPGMDAGISGFISSWGKLGLSPSDGGPFLHDGRNKIVTCGVGVWGSREPARDLSSCETR